VLIACGLRFATSKQPLCDEAILSQTGLPMTYAKVSDWLQMHLLENGNGIGQSKYRPPDPPPLMEAVQKVAESLQDS